MEKKISKFGIWLSSSIFLSETCVLLGHISMGKTEFCSFSWCTNKVYIACIYPLPTVKLNSHLQYPLRNNFPLEPCLLWKHSWEGLILWEHLRKVARENREVNEAGCRPKTSFVSTSALSSHAWKRYLSFRHSHQNTLNHESDKIQSLR